jgi:hypothetical protein
LLLHPGRGRPRSRAVRQGKTKDYGLWYWAGAAGSERGSALSRQRRWVFRFIYPPLPAILLAIPSWFGKIPLYIVLSVLNALAWWFTGTFSDVMTGSGRRARSVAGGTARISSP